MTDDQAGRWGEYTRCCKVSKILTSYKWYSCLLGDACNTASSDWTDSWREHHSEISLSLSLVSFTWFKRCIDVVFETTSLHFVWSKIKHNVTFIFNFNACIMILEVIYHLPIWQNVKILKNSHAVEIGKLWVFPHIK